MRWFRFGSGKRRAEQDPGRQQEIYRQVRDGFGAHVPGRFADQAAGTLALLDGDDGIVVAAAILRDYADAVAGAMRAQGFPAERRDYRWAWRSAGPRLRSPLVTGQGGPFHPYVQVAAAVTVVATRSKQLVRVTAPEPVLTHLLEILDVITSSWEYGGVAADVDTATLAGGLIAAVRDLRAAMAEEPPLPSPIREQMRRNNTVDVWDPATHRVVGGFNPGRSMREAFLA
ncbi:hypothetical protein [Actinoplanes utahensis]|uniref:Uncharacterized protein n=1 Tax=Actinoplanes utahensis TaxID=1869 RepID=A0A0A6UEJ6_ACTUT|nr:hypothetical protein [Actinoplanes utahensis]KHD74455.1 hypothetical protein MB27_28450 [Actinoplanes utahensis]GIF31424.1 hypothetical protein Aut01nite_44100 [Actinoplanes utahensis]